MTNNHWSRVLSQMIEIKRHKELQRQKLLLSSLMISFDFVNHFKPRGAEFLNYILKAFW